MDDVAASGEPLVITRNGRPLAQQLSSPSGSRKPFGSLALTNGRSVDRTFQRIVPIRLRQNTS
jgi:antitoxin (DNA-binding transcriptional repressor) of toxin-antitoxin stability system